MRIRVNKRADAHIERAAIWWEQNRSPFFRRVGRRARGSLRASELTTDHSSCDAADTSVSSIEMGIDDQPGLDLLVERVLMRNGGGVRSVSTNWERIREGSESAVFSQ